MPGFGEMLEPEEVAGVRAYIVNEARKAYEKQQTPHDQESDWGVSDPTAACRS